ncbi:hypothetical protein THAOC_04159 [Thalassiosira oceanica]|uniref:Uncharacterized protein n=1 Tax=Thalassiosira oceanica TaxID=159749 RepID=K0T5Y7_THAOC|nr:hypothetical protein THAOC_04159 [Thalassiosira oceanica]|eukprot:EJK74178.1 hypothetical protein THAOC_04159 [Thalassiosira oceanica]
MSFILPPTPITTQNCSDLLTTYRSLKNPKKCSRFNFFCSRPPTLRRQQQQQQQERINKGRQAASRKGTIVRHFHVQGVADPASTIVTSAVEEGLARGSGGPWARGKGLVELTLLSDLEMSFFRRGSRALVVEKG